tara:strand:+ start:1576 stop:2202 length:627 start_codon:yes stop_codon:yes gene_type:complete
MKIIFQLSLIGLIFVISFLFYNSYFLENKNVIQDKMNSNENIINSRKNSNDNLSSNSSESEIENNQIKNLLYKVDYSESGKYEIKAKLSKLNYVEGVEKVSMFNVSAFIVDKNANRIDIKSDNAFLNTATYKTSFFGDVNIKYLGSVVTANKLDFSFEENLILISENILYKNINTKIKADNVKINLLTKEIEVFMNNSQDKIELIHIK